MNIDENMLNVVNTLTKYETVPETNSDEDNEMPKLTVLDDHEEIMHITIAIDAHSIPARGCRSSKAKDHRIHTYELKDAQFSKVVRTS